MSPRSGNSATREETAPRAHTRVSAAPSPLATVAQLKRLNDLGLLPKALAEGNDRVTRETAWVVLEEALEAGLWDTPRRDGRPDWAPTRRRAE
jgi:hypothetical protein